ncbi:N-acetyl sugar amidotransferase [uncultured Roseivirga sp.]|uniref:N-acetyl sugar amidotransferase n=1 Tax=uncultured Roseivirga sp. TaxID=543088 RepID=UPI002590B906|nr:N-acetyl sugar amidotransferase [uncultured Roseivirga sp.]
MKVKSCSKCIMDTTDSGIIFDEQGVCNHCHDYERKIKAFFDGVPDREEELKNIVNRIKKDGRGKKYDCIIGVSGGVDSTYLAYLSVKRFGLRPLAVHFDNGWNSELSVENIHRALSKLGIELYTHVVDWEEFRDIQLSFLKASVPDAEVPTDHAISALLFSVANKYGIKYILGGSNIVTEGTMPRMWTYGVHDSKYIRAVQKQFGTQKLKTYPYYGLIKFFKYLFIDKIQNIHFLNYIDYDKEEAMRLIEDELGWKYYGGKHFESIYTRFFQAYILPNKFNIDKRKAHYSTLIQSGQMTRNQALDELKKPVYPEGMLEEDMEYAIKKLGITQEEFQRIMGLPVKNFKDYPSHYGFRVKIKKYIDLARSKRLWPKSV